MHKARGFTLIELLVIVAIAAILLSLTFPNMQSTIDRRGIAAEASRLSHSFNYARSKAVTEQQQNPVVVRRTGGVGNYWADGWQIFIDTNSDNIYQTGTDDILLQEHSFGSNNTTILTNGRVFISYNAQGRLNNSTTTFSICDQAKNTTFDGSLITVNTVGRANISDIAGSSKGASC
ncbi:MAG: prepilin-type N-terminal cleavage/methylation domain-containing protein [Oceanicoccus sp.]|jgi:prepilin-type N-terminal cleavage/methylation domain-containing protein